MATVWKCNACDHEGKTSREHLIHVAIGRVILRNRNLTREDVRRHLRSGKFREFGLYDDPLRGEVIRPAWLNQEIRGLICRECNQTWARRLEEDAGNNLYDFTILRRRAQAQLLRRWAWFFAMKLWFMNSRPQAIAEGPLHPVLSSLADATVEVRMPVLLARLDSSPRISSFSAMAGGWRGAHTPYMSWIIRGVVWVVAATDAPKITLPIPVTPLVEGLRLQDVR